MAKDLAIEAPTAEEVARAAQALRLSPTLETGVAHPARWWMKEGRVLVDIRGSKSVLLQQIAQKLKERTDELERLGERKVAPHRGR